MSRPNRRSQKGSVIILALMAALVLSLVGSAMFSYFVTLIQQQTRQNLLNTLMQIQMNVADAIISDPAWSYTTLAAHNPPATTVPSLFTLYDATGAVFYDSTNPSVGFTIGGKYCSPWSASGSSECPLRLELSWQQVSSCHSVVTPSYQISATYNYQPGHILLRTNLNWQTYSGRLSMCRPVAIQSFSCVGVAPPTACLAPDNWYCTSTGWSCKRIFY